MQKKLRRLGLGLFRMGIGGLVGYQSVMPLLLSAKRQYPGLADSALLFLGLFIGSFLGGFIVSVALHELGHVVAGKIAGFRFAFMIFWPVKITRRGSSGLSIKLSLRNGIGMGGLAGMVPVAGLPMRQAYLTMLSGGPLASLLVALLAGSAAIGMGLGQNLFGGVFWIFAITSLLLFFLTIIPMKAGGFLSDGAAIRLLKKGSPEEIDRYVALLECGSAIAAGTRPAGLNPSHVETLLTSGPEEPVFFQARHFAFLHAADSNNLTGAREFMEEIQQNLEKSPVIMRGRYQLDAAWLEAREGNVDKARSLLSKANQGLTEPCELKFIEAEIALAEGKTDDARRLAGESLGLIDHSMIPGAHEFARQRLLQISQI